MNQTNNIEEDLQIRAKALEHLKKNPDDLTVKFLVRYGLPVFIRNNVKTNAVILIDFKLTDGRTKSFRVENTDIPQEISAFVPHEAIGKSFHLDQSIGNRTVVLVDPSQALEELKDPIKARKNEKLRASRYSKDSDEALPASLKSEPAFETINLTPGKPEQTISASSVKDFLRALVLQHQEKTIDTEELIDKVTDNARSFTKTDWLFLKSEINDPQVIGLADQQLSAAG